MCTHSHKALILAQNKAKWVWFNDFVSLSKMIPNILNNVFYVDETW